MNKRLTVFLISVLIVFAMISHSATAHPGRLDANGGHYCRTNCANYGLANGQYHYHSGGSAPAPAPTPKPVPVAPRPVPATPKPRPVQRTSPEAAPVPPAPAPIAKPAPKPKKTIERVNGLVKQSRREKILLVDLLLAESGKGKTTQQYETIKVTKIAKSRLSNATEEPRVVDNQKLYYVSSVTDGDTIKVVVDGKIEKVRLLGIDTPETRDPRKPIQCFGKEASDYAKSLLQGQYVRLETDSTQGDKDKYNRLLRYVYLENGTEVNANLVENGYAVAYVRYPVKNMENYKRLQEKARNNNVGLWSSCR